jgi:hypothetical protein
VVATATATIRLTNLQPFTLPETENASHRYHLIFQNKPYLCPPKCFKKLADPSATNF